ncbi:metallophosphoesterase [Gemmatimonadota bacterium]
MENRKIRSRILALLSSGVLAASLSCNGEEAFTIVLLPDTQYYSLRDVDAYKAQTRWIAEKRQSKNIRFVIHLGDITDANGGQEWVNASTAHRTLECGGVPFSVVPGNHDYPDSDGPSRNTSRYNANFGPERFEGRPWYGGHRGTTNDNNYSFFDVGDLKFMVVGIEFCPRQTALNWANYWIGQYPDRRVIVVTHSHLKSDGGYNSCTWNDGNTGQEVWEELVKENENIFMVVSGHRQGSAHNVPDVPRQVYEVLADFQDEPDEDGEVHGRGFLKTLTFQPTEDRIIVETFSVPDESVSLALDYQDGPVQVFEYEMGPVGTEPSRGIVRTAGPFVQPWTPRKSSYDMTVNIDDERHQRRPAVARSSGGRSVVVWEDDSSGTERVYQIYARTFDVHGCPWPVQFVVNAESAGDQRKPDVAMDDQGNYVVVWRDESDETGRPIKMRGFNADGTEWLPQQSVHLDSEGFAIRDNPAVAMNGAGDFVVVWQETESPVSFQQNLEIRMRGFPADGDPWTEPVTVNTDPSGQQSMPDVAIDDSGNAVVVWQDESEESGHPIRMRGLDADGDEWLPQQSLDCESDACPYQGNPAAAMNGAGDFVVVWQEASAPFPANFEIRMQGFQSSGTPWPDAITVNSDQTRVQSNPATAMNDEGRIVVVWEDDRTGAEGKFQIYAAGFSFSSNGDKEWGDLTVNNNSSGQQEWPAVAMDDDRGFWVAWEDDVNNNHWREILACGYTARRSESGQD